MDIRSHTLKIRNLPQGHKRIACINAKPYALLGLLLLIGILLVAWMKYYMLGGILLAAAVYNFLFIKNERLVEFYDEYVVFYHINTYRDECFLLFWNDIVSWQIKPTKSIYDELAITLRNQKEITLKCVSKHKLIRYFNTYAPKTKQDPAVISKPI